ncbi:MAG: hypothetical protein A2V70_14285 [Planctomycetes bacterium RBG_13_63_9]|nr:MAG: hypothetical protein A2V70_14285 [Planctomycetes bacterium RBG_13_63_9]
MVIEYLKANGGAWPRNWDDLRNCYETARNDQGRHYCSFEQARACMAVDFEADPKVLAQAKSLHGERPFCVVYQRHGRTGEGPWDPNQRIFRYLTSQDSANQDSANTADGAKPKP